MPPLSIRRVIAAGTIGNVLEWYDFSIYGFFAAAIGRTFFPEQEPVSQVLAAFGVFAAGYLMRPLGGIVVGHIADHYGRTVALSFSVVAMALPTFLSGYSGDAMPRKARIYGLFVRSLGSVSTWCLLLPYLPAAGAAAVGPTGRLRPPAKGRTARRPIAGWGPLWALPPGPSYLGAFTDIDKAARSYAAPGQAQRPALWSHVMACDGWGETPSGTKVKLGTGWRHAIFSRTCSCLGQ